MEIESNKLLFKSSLDGMLPLKKKTNVIINCLYWGQSFGPKPGWIFALVHSKYLMHDSPGPRVLEMSPY